MAKKKTNKQSLELYSAEQFDKIEKHIEKHFGEIENYFQEKETDDIKLNVYVIPPDFKNHFYTLVTSGMGAHLMNVPEELDDQKLKRAELVICLPPSWKIENGDIEYYWPVQLLNLLSRLPIEENTWLGWGHTVDYGTNFAPNTEFSGVMLINSMAGADSHICKFSDDDEVNFYQVIPLYPREIEFKNKNGASALMGRWSDDFPFVVDIDRKSPVPENFMEIIDTVNDHASKVDEKELDILDICGANHIAAYLRWAIEHGLADEDFTDYFNEELEQIRSGEYDIRKFLINSLGGELTMDIFNEEGQAFAEYYYDFYHGDDEPCYPGDVDSMALDYFGEEKYNSEEFCDEAYLFVPFDEDYYKAMSRYIDRNYEKFKKIHK